MVFEIIPSYYEMPGLVLEMVFLVFEMTPFGSFVGVLMFLAGGRGLQRPIAAKEAGGVFR
jgi:hypothetical protein